MTIGSGPPAIRRKWRPSLAMVIGAVLTVVVALPLMGMAAVVALSRSPDALLDSLSNNSGKIAGAAIVIAAVTVVVGILFWRLVSGPVQRLVRWTETIAAQGAAEPAQHAHYGTQELARLAASFAEMVDRLRERSDYIATFAAHVSHELKSPLTSIAAAAELMREAGNEMDASARDRFLQNIEADALRLSSLVARMRDLAQADQARPAGSVALALVAAELRERFATLAIGCPEDGALLPLPADDALAVLAHLADNAHRHGARNLTLQARIGNGRTVLDIGNDGEPIAPGNRAKLFEPFYTTRRESGGTGMGLAIARAMLRAHGGDIELADTGTTVQFRILLPEAPIRR
ncbi:sensor histidine kinase [Consotaella aegiceratis]|uniref:sensor histidine kinase n=1 Tax=Consotaella aegiceratis TaxID=3097961 RepID=UPI002F42B9DF